MMLLKTALLLVAAVALIVPGVQSDKWKLLNYLKSIDGKKMLSGAFGGYINVGDASGFSQGEADRIFQWTKKYPAVYAVDCAQGWGKTAHGRESDLIECFNNAAVEYFKKGGIISVSHHLPNPIFAGNNPGDIEGYKKQISNEQYERLLREGTPERNRWYQFLNKIAAGLAAYQARGIPVLYRPLHEMNGEWFWWGATGYNTNDQKRHEVYKALWRDMHNFFTNHKGLKNLLWVYSPDSKREFKTSFYPGDQYVDIVGLDAYVNNFNDVKGYDEMLRLGKPFCFAEIGPDSNSGSFDYTAAINTINSRFPRAVYFLPWNAQWSPSSNKNPWGAYNNGRVVNRGEFSL